MPFLLADGSEYVEDIAFILLMMFFYQLWTNAQSFYAFMQ